MSKFEKRSVFGKGVKPIAKFQQNDKLRRDIYAEIRKLNKTLHVNRLDSRHAQTIEKFINAMIPPDDIDYSRLPVYAKRTAASKPDKTLCVFCLVSCLVQCYWGYLETESDEDLKAVETALEVLRDINRHYNIMRLYGGIRKGWVLKL